MHLYTKYLIVIAVAMLPAGGPIIAFEPHIWPQLQTYCRPHCEHYIWVAALTIWVGVAWIGCGILTYFYHLRRGACAVLLSAMWLPFCCFDMAMRCRGGYSVVADELDDIREVWMEPMSPRSIQRNEERVAQFYSRLGEPMS